MVWFCSVHDLGLLWNYFLWFLLLIFNGIYNLLILLLLWFSGELVLRLLILKVVALQS
jgi:hypothetical protein